MSAEAAEASTVVAVWKPGGSSVGGGKNGFAVRRADPRRRSALALLAAASPAACAASGVDLVPPDLQPDDDASSPDTGTPGNDDSSLPPVDSGNRHDAGVTVVEAGSPDALVPPADVTTEPPIDAAPPPQDAAPPDAVADAEIDSEVPETSIPDAPSLDSAPPTDSSLTPTCNGLPEWFAGITAMEVQHFGEKYSCLVSGWCSEGSATAVAAYEPGKRWAWMQAWSDQGPCPAAATDAGGSDAGHP